MNGNLEFGTAEKIFATSAMVAWVPGLLANVKGLVAAIKLWISTERQQM